MGRIVTLINACCHVASKSLVNGGFQTVVRVLSGDQNPYPLFISNYSQFNLLYTSSLSHFNLFLPLLPLFNLCFVGNLQLLGNFRRSLGKFRGTRGLLLKSTVRELPGKSPRNFRGSGGKLWEVQGVSRNPGEV